MKRLSMGIVTFVLVLVIAGAAFRKPLIASPASSPSPHAAKQQVYYWYTYPDDTYNDFTTIANEESELFYQYGVLIDQSPSGGTLLMKGYLFNTYPHNQPASVLLYGHF
ncbi:hypothetical protein [Puia dinghuensis]|uniref:Uncharacterized protein n=1 Tax=Puia dinghuensis TaxID=1792502 RepID=A0A8J2XWF8_9BACT|nr:hypothetical protein [Puia dinghuensis]GGB23632.1 hypothetical protein GCM10011511_54360 [Puia dinghuensis]